MAILDPMISSEISPVMSDYYLSEDKVHEGEQDIVNIVREYDSARGVYAAWINSDLPQANVIRTHEARIFPEIPYIMDAYEEQTRFLALVDTRAEEGRITHAFRISDGSLENVDQNHTVVQNIRSGIPLIDDLIKSNQGISLAEIDGYYRQRGIKLSKSFSVETNFRITKTENYNGLPTPQLGYIALFKLVEQSTHDVNEAAIFAHLNKPAIMSLGAVGVEYEPIAGLTNLRTPTVGDKKFDDKYHPVAIMATPKNITNFRNLSLFGVPDVHIR